MKTMKRALLALAIIAGIPFAGNAQDPEFTQFYANPLYLNPALTGVERCPRVILNYRNQYVQ